MGGSSTTNNNSESQSVNEIPQWVQNAGQANYALAQDVASQPLQQYQGQLVSSVSPQMQQGWNLAANSGSVGQGAQSAGQAALMSGAGYTPQQVGAPTQSQLAGYMNPYTQSVINATLPIMQQNLGLSQDQQQNAASSANAFGGSRQAIQQGVTQAQGAMGMGQMAAQLNQANFAQGMGAAQQANLANQQAGLTGNAQQIAAGGALGTLGAQQMQNNLANYGMLTSAGALQEQQQQNVINAQISQLAQAQGYPAQQLGVLESALGMTPYNTGTSGSSASTTEQQTSNPAAIATGAMQMMGNLFGSGGQGMAALGALGIGSDRRLKTDIVKVGKHHTGVPIYGFRYKGDPKHYPKVVGPMAEDVAKIAPHAVSSIPGSGGKMAVDMRALNALGPGPAGGAGSIGAGSPLIGRGVSQRMGQGMGPPVPGALAAPGVAGSIGGLGSMMRPPRSAGRRHGRAPPMRGALA
jgi:hypothetical protein